MTRVICRIIDPVRDVDCVVLRRVKQTDLAGERKGAENGEMGETAAADESPENSRRDLPRRQRGRLGLQSCTLGYAIDFLLGLLESLRRAAPHCSRFCLV